MAAIAQLKALLGLENAKYKAKMRESESATKRFGRTLSGVGRTMAAAFSIGAIVAATRSLVNFASEIRHTADNLEVGTEDLQAINAIALKYGLSVEQLGKGLASLRQAQGRVAEGDEMYADAVRALNVELEAFTEVDTIGALELIAKGYAASADRAKAFNAVTELMGRQGKRASAMLEELADKGLAEVREEAKSTGQVIDDELITKLELLGTRVSQVQLRLKVFGAQAIARVGRGGAQAGAMWGSLSEEFEREKDKGSKFIPIQYRGIAAAWRVWRSGGLGRAGQAAADETREPEKPTTKSGAKTQARSDAKEVTQAAESGATEARARALAKESQQVEELYQRLAQTRKRFEGQIAGVSAGGGGRVFGRGTMTDEMARVGGKIGASRAGLGAADRQLRMQAQANADRREIRDLTREMNDALQELRDKDGAV